SIERALALLCPAVVPGEVLRKGGAGQPGFEAAAAAAPAGWSGKFVGGPGRRRGRACASRLRSRVGPRRQRVVAPFTGDRVVSDMLATSDADAGADPGAEDDGEDTMGARRRAISGFGD